MQAITTDLIKTSLIDKSAMQSLPNTQERRCSLSNNQMNFLSRYKTAEALMIDYTPDKQSTCASQKVRCVTGKSPSLVDFRRMFGENKAVLWLSIQIKDFSEYTGVKRKLTTFQIDDTARIILSDFYFLKMSEILLFFAYIKGGRYERFFGAVDPLVITSSLRMFLKDRAKIIETHEASEQERKRQEEANERASAVTMNIEEWKRYKPYFDKGISVQEWKQKQINT